MHLMLRARDAFLNAAALAVTLLLSGCFESTTELFTTRDAAWPVKDGAVFAVVPIGDLSALPSAARILRSSNGYLYQPLNSLADRTISGDVQVGYLVPLGNNAYLGSFRKALDFSGKHSYVGFEADGKAFRRWDVTCKDFKELLDRLQRTLAEFDAVDMQNACIFSTAAGVKKAVTLMMDSNPADQRLDPAPP